MARTKRDAQTQPVGDEQESMVHDGTNEMPDPMGSEAGQDGQEAGPMTAWELSQSMGQSPNGDQSQLGEQHPELDVEEGQALQSVPEQTGGIMYAGTGGPASMESDPGSGSNMEGEADGLGILPPGEASGQAGQRFEEGGVPINGEGARPSASRLRMPRGRGPRVVSIDAQRTVETERDKLRNDLLDLVESLKGRKILTGTIQGVERLASNPEMCYAVIYHGDIKVIIPVLEAVEEPADYRDQPKGDVLHYLLNKRLGAEVDFIVKRIDQECEVVSASRLEAMAMKRREYYFRTDRDGNYQIYEGIRAEARVVSVIRAGIFVDLFGVECYIPLRELSYQRWVDAASHYQPGQRVLVKVLEVDRSDRNRPTVVASVKQAGENPYEVALKKYVVDNLYVGTVSMVDLTGVFVSLDGGIDCLCSHPKRGRPPRGARVTVRILGINYENNRIWGVITHMSSVR